MTVKEAIRIFKNHQRVSVKEKTRKTYRYLFGQFEAQFGEHQLESIDPEGLSQFLVSLTEGLAKATQRLRYAQLKSFYNFIIENCGLEKKIPVTRRCFPNPFACPSERQERFWIRNASMR